MILAAPERIEEYTKKGCWGERTLIDDFQHHADTMPATTAFVDPLNKEALLGTAPERVSYRRFRRAVDATATALLAEGIGKDDVVLVPWPNMWKSRWRDRTARHSPKTAPWGNSSTVVPT